jgi:diguanylate cyclase (GGDEF)-like protein/PAS domain S-box-containing protein
MPINGGMVRRAWSVVFDPSPVGSGEPLLARVIGMLFVFGGVLGFVSLVLPHPPASNDPALIAIDAASFAVGLAYLVAARRIAPWLVHTTVAGSSTMICSAVYFTGVAAGLYPTMFVWIVLFTAYFFSSRAALAHLAWLLACYAAVMAMVPDSAGFSTFTRWLLTAIALLVASALTAWLVARRKGAEERAQRFFDLSSDMLCIANAEGYFVELNHAWNKTLGYSRAELRSRPFIDFVHPDDRERTQAEAVRIFESDDAVQFENRYRARDGSWRWLLWTSTFSAQHGLIYARATDLTERKRLEAEREELMEELHSQARTDPLTGVPNRRWLDDELRREMARASRKGIDLFLAVIDLDYFKRYNDRHGHGAGDMLLVETCRSWRASLRAGDFLARYGGEEFVVLLPGCSAAEAHGVIERLRAVTPSDQTCSAGIAVWDGLEEPQRVIDRADAALYEAKAAGRDRTVTHHGPVREAPVHSAAL